MFRPERPWRAASRAGARTVAACLMLAVPVAVAASPIKDNLYGVKTLGPGQAVAVGAFGSVYRTRDGGKTWDSPSTGTTLALFSVDFANEKTGWAVGKSAVTIRTTDGGNTWTKQTSPIPPDKHLFKVAAVDANTAWAVGDWGAIATTKDGGATWTDRSLGVHTQIREETPGRVVNTITEDVILYDVTFVDPDHGYICGEFGTVLATTDGGVTWVKRDTGVDKTLFGMGFKSPTEGWVVGMDGVLLHTKDGGQTWALQHGRQDDAMLEDVGFLETLKNPGLYAVRVSGKYGVVVGDTGLLLVTQDGGETWSQVALSGKDRLVWMRDANIGPQGEGYLVGAAGFVARLDRDQVTSSSGPATPVANP